MDIIILVFKATNCKERCFPSNAEVTDEVINDIQVDCSSGLAS